MSNTKLVWARQIELIAHAITNEVHRAHLANQLANEGAVIDG
jgi:hypothetical protein